MRSIELAEASCLSVARRRIAVIHGRAALVAAAIAAVACASPPEPECTSATDCVAQACQVSVCADGACQSSAVAHGTLCVGANGGEGRCLQGACREAGVCGDGFPCHVPGGTSVDCGLYAGVADVSIQCDDGDACTAPDRCTTPGTCAGPNVSCEDGNYCTIDACKAGACTFTPRTCGDGDPCTVDSCAKFQCIHVAVECNDDQPCTIEAFCEQGGCTRISAPEGIACGADCTCPKPGYGPRVGAFLAGCSTGADCNSGVCVQIAGALRCSQVCVDACPFGLACMATKIFGDDAAACLQP